ncbi:hypothetical protein [Clostridium brassicae]|uniref:DUF4179 domain-containing protein n=1 Tax=Clostridium brassicae TaxID=2999072 RepID=A0ABT4DBS5_9CLOT|nr:hypothetical protein [Clostridium brassicae]MCY6958686.1 hypothetical protein [Clostridium brassicae]
MKHKYGLNQEIINLKKQLDKDYLNEYQFLCKQLKQDSEMSTEAKKACLGVLTLLYKAQSENQEPKSIYNGNFQNFYNKLLEKTLTNDINNLEKTDRKNIIIVLLSVLIVILISVFICTENGVIGTIANGMSYLQSNSNYASSYKKLQAPVEIELNLANLESNIGKEIYQDGQCKIIISNIEKDLNNEYKVIFRSIGTYDKNGGRLVSPIKHYVTQGKHQKYDLEGNLKTTYQRTTYMGSWSAICPLIYKDGDQFTYSLFPIKLYENGTFLLQDKLQKDGNVKVSLEGLIETTWMKN